MSSYKQMAVKTRKTDVPDNSKTVLKTTTEPTLVSSVKRSGQIISDFFSKHTTKQIEDWVDEEDRNCFMICARKLSITWSDNPKYWTWFFNKELPDEEAVEAAKLKDVCWLDITGKFDTRNLTPGIKYKVVFVVKLVDPAYGWETPVNLKLVLPNDKEKPQEKKVDLRQLPRYKWVNIIVGEFVPEKSTAGEITFSMYEHESRDWKKGLIVNGVSILPKT